MKGGGLPVLVLSIAVAACSEPGNPGLDDGGAAETAAEARVVRVDYGRAVTAILEKIAEHYADEASEGQPLRVQVDFDHYVMNSTSPDRLMADGGVQVDWLPVGVVRNAYLDGSRSDLRVTPVTGCPDRGRGRCAPEAGVLHVEPGPMGVLSDGSAFVYAYVMRRRSTIMVAAILSETGANAEVVRVAIGEGV